MSKIDEKILKEFVRSELSKQLNEASLAGAFKWLKDVATGRGKLEKGGKLFGRDKWEKGATAQFKKELEKVSNASVKGLIDQIKKEVPDYPNNTGGSDKGHQEFLVATIEIGTLYDSLAAATEKYDPKSEKQEEGAMSPDVANGLVRALRMYVKILLDRDLMDRYKHFLKEELQNSDDLIEEIEEQFKELEQVHEAWNPFKKKKKYAKDDFLKVGDPGEEGERSGTMKGLESNMLPLVLGAVGSGFGAAHIVALNAIQPVLNSPELQNWGVEEIKDAIEQGGKETTLAVQRGDGLTRLLSRAAETSTGGHGKGVVDNIDILAKHHDMDPHKFIDGLHDIQSAKGPITKEISVRAQHVLYDWVQQGGREGAFINPKGVAADAVEFARNSKYGGEDLAEILSGKAHTGGGLKGLGITLFGVDPNGVATIINKIVVPRVTRQIVATGVTKATTASFTGSLGILGSTGLLSYLSIAAITAGAAISLIRAKGRKSSRAQVLDDLYKTLAWFPGGKLDPEKEKEGGGGEEGGTGPDPGPDPITPVDLEEGARSCDELLAKLEKLNLQPGDIVTLERPASARVKWARKNPDAPLPSREVMVTTVPGFKFLGENLSEEDLDEAWNPFKRKDKWAQKVDDMDAEERAEKGNPGRDYTARVKPSDPGTDTGYAAGEVKLYDYEATPYAKQCEEHPWVIEVQFMTITSKGDPVFASPVAEVTKQDGKSRPRVPAGKLRDQMKETGEVPEGYKYEFLVKKHDSSDEAFLKFIEEFKAQLSPERAENFSKTIEQEIRSRRGMKHDKVPYRGDTKAINRVPDGTERPKRRRKLYPGRPEINIPPTRSPESDAAVAKKRRSRRKARRMREAAINETFNRWSVIAGIGKDK